MNFYKDLLQVFIRQDKSPTRYCDTLYDTCAAAFRQHINSIPETTLPLASNHQPLFPCYLKFVKQVVLMMEEDPDMLLCTFQSLIEQLRVKDLLNMDRARDKDYRRVNTHMRYLLGVMTLLPGDYNFLEIRMNCNADQNGLKLAKTPLKGLLQLGFFEENISNAARSISAVLRAEPLNVNFLCNVLGVEICWVMNLGEHLLFDGPRRQLKLFRLPSFCEINLVSPGSFLLSALESLTSSKVEQQGLTTGILLVTKVCNSYNLIFQVDRPSRKHVYRVEKPKLERDGAALDPLPLQNCDQRIPSGRSHRLEEFYPVDSFKCDFSAFARCLTILQNFAETALPKRRRSLWNDRRNLKKSYTFNAVVIFGSLGVIIVLIQIVLSGMQVAYAIKPVAKS